MSSKHNGVRLIVKENSTWPKGAHLKKLMLADRSVSLAMICSRLSEIYGKDKLVGVQLQVGRRHEKWTNSTMIEALRLMKQAQAKIDEVNGNSSERRFWQKQILLEEVEIGLKFDILASELGHFSRPISLA